MPHVPETTKILFRINNDATILANLLLFVERLDARYEYLERAVAGLRNDVRSLASAVADHDAATRTYETNTTGLYVQTNDAIRDMSAQLRALNLLLTGRDDATAEQTP